MTYDEFSTRISNDLQTALESKYGPIRVTPAEVMRLDGRSYKGVSFGRIRDDVSVTFNVEAAFDQFSSGRDYASVLDAAADTLRMKMDQIPTIDKDLLKSYDRVREHLTMELVGIEKNRDVLPKIPHKKIEDMALVYRCDLGETPEGTLSVLITDQMLHDYQVTPEELHHDAVISAPSVRPPELKPMYEVLSDMIGSGEDLSAMGPPFYVATNTLRDNGASVMAYPGFLDEAIPKVGSQYFILPSSRHEVLFLKDTGEYSAAELKDMVSFINAHEVAPEDVLTDNVYHYDGIEKVLETAESFEERMRGEPAIVKPSVLQDLKNKQAEASEHSLSGPPAHHDPVL